MGAYLSEPNKEKETFSGQGTGHSWASSAMQGWRSSQEDSFIAMSEFGETDQGLSFFAVFDGHGGREVAAFCSMHMAGELKRQLAVTVGVLEASCDEETIQNKQGEAFVNSFHAVDDSLRSPVHQEELITLKEAGKDKGAVSPKKRALELLQSSIQSDLASARTKGALTKEQASLVMNKMALLRRMETQMIQTECTDLANRVGCTAVAILLTKNSIVCANTGDSRAIVCRAGSPVELSHDHKPDGADERKRIEAAGGHVEQIPVGSRVHYRVNGNLNVSRAIGDLQYKQRHDLGPEEQVISSTPEIICERRSPEDEFVVLACDGVWDVKTNQEVCDFVSSRLKDGKDCTEVTEELLDDCCSSDPKATQGLGGDNMTCIIIQLFGNSDDNTEKP